MTTTESLKEAIKRDLPTWLREDPAFRDYILDLTRQLYTRRDETSDWFHQTLEEMRRERERQDVRWREGQAELTRLREEQERKWEEQNRKWGENQTELKRLREEQERKWEANQAEHKELHQEIKEAFKRFDRSIGALGARWGIRSEKAFRDALAGILEKTFGVEVFNYCEYDDSGEVFGRPEQIELDVIVKNGLLIICELKSSVDKAGMYSFERKARFYERHHGRQANRLIVVSPMIDSRAQQVAERLGVETYGEPEEVSE